MKRLAILVLALWMAGTAWQHAMAQQRGRGFGRGGGSLGLLSQESVQKELQITDEQKQKVADYAAKQRESFSGLQDLSREERQAEFAKIQKASEEELAKILDAKQLARLKQISLQQRGVQALSNPEVAAALTLSDDQKAKVETIQQELRDQMGEIFQGAAGGGDRDEARKKVEEAQSKANEKLQAVLTAEQQTKWKELNGEPFKGEIVRRRGGGEGGQRGPGQNRGADVSRPQGPFQLASFKADDDDDDDDKKSSAKDDDDDDEKSAGKKRDDDDDGDDKKSAGKKDDDDKPHAKRDKNKGDRKAEKARKHKRPVADKKEVQRMHARHGGHPRRGHGPSFGRHPMGGPNAAVWNHVAERMGDRGPRFGHRPSFGNRPPMGRGFAMHHPFHREHGPMAHRGHRGPGAALAHHRGHHGPGFGRGGQFAAHHRGPGPAFGHRGHGHGERHGHDQRFARHHEHHGHRGPAFAHHGHHRGPGPGSFAAHRGPQHHGQRHHLSSWRSHHEGDDGPRRFEGPRDEHRRRPPAPPHEPRKEREERSEVSQPAEQLTGSGDTPRDVAVSLARLQQLEQSLDRLAQQIADLRRSIRR